MNWTFFQGDWHAGSPAIIGPQTQAMWLATVVFDGARAVDGTIPDLAAHCARCVQSAKAMGLRPVETPEFITQVAIDSVARFPAGTPLYIRPMFWPESGGLVPDPDSTRFALYAYEEPLPPATGFAAVLGNTRRPRPDTMVLGAKASCLYPAMGLAVAAVRRQGFNTMVVLDPWDNVAEFAFANLFLVRDGVIFTPTPNSTFLNGITRRRAIDLMRQDGLTVVETTLRYSDVEGADELFSSGNHGKLQPLTRLGTRSFAIGPVFKRAREMYWDFAHSAGSALASPAGS